VQVLIAISLGVLLGHFYPILSVDMNAHCRSIETRYSVRSGLARDRSPFRGLEYPDGPRRRPGGRRCRVQKQMIDAQFGVVGKGIPEILPERVDPLPRVRRRAVSTRGSRRLSPSCRARSASVQPCPTSSAPVRRHRDRSACHCKSPAKTCGSEKPVIAAAARARRLSGNWPTDDTG
jgi:hypothetical protein